LPWLRELYAAWEFFGPQTIVMGGMAVSVIDDSHKLYPARLAWLDEHGYRTETVREFHLVCWRVLDAEVYAVTNEQLNDARKTSE